MTHPTIDSVSDILTIMRNQTLALKTMVAETTYLDNNMKHRFVTIDACLGAIISHLKEIANDPDNN